MIIEDERLRVLLDIAPGRPLAPAVLEWLYGQASWVRDREREQFLGHYLVTLLVEQCRKA